ncbi:MAG: (2Fe-2S)-binding protein, partial [Bdellovibrionales bacterium]|nr:(2Fe-2S)-binding protein [Bdellovibrionales bacterium]
MKVRFLPKDIELEIEPNQTVMDLAHKNGIFIKSVCNGVPNCAECRVKLVEGEYNVLPPSSKELALIGSGHFIDQRRLSCQLHCFGSITVDLTEQEKKEHEGPPGSRRFQVDLRNEGVVSKAVTGNLIQQDKDIVEAMSEASVEERDKDTGKPDRHGGKFQVRAEAIIDLTKGNRRTGESRDRKQRNPNKTKSRQGKLRQQANPSGEQNHSGKG